jgi:vitamin B12 transporter
MCVSLVALAPLALPVASASAQPDDDRNILLMYYKEDELVVESATRSRKSITQTAENVTVITAEDIKLMNARTVAEVMNQVPGVQVFMTGGPGSSAPASIQGSDNRHTAVFVDGVPLNNLSDNVADLGVLPVQNIQKIEVIKGPASSAWGSALGGVINIITKSGSAERPGFMVSASLGERSTEDHRVEASGREDRLGYYLSAGRLRSDGFRARNDFDGDRAFLKLGYDLTRNTSITFSIGYEEFDRGVAELVDYDLFLRDSGSAVRSTAGLKNQVSDTVTLDLSLWHLRQDQDIHNYLLSTGSEFSKDTYEDEGFGTGVKLTWQPIDHTIVLGADLESKKLLSNTIAGGAQSLRKTACYANDTMTFGRLSVIPGIRFDKTDTNGEFTSPSLGLTYKPAEALLLRAYAARGFSLPPFAFTFGDNIFHISNPDLKMERVWSYQAGAEATLPRNLWLKASAFQHDVSDVIVTEMLSASTFRSVNSGRQRRQGMELELRTAPVFHTSLTAGAVFMHARDRDTGETIMNIPQRTYDLGLLYDHDALKAQVKGHAISWNTDAAVEGKYSAFVFDLHLTKKVPLRGRLSLEVFADVNNLFNDDQYAFSVYRNPGRWVDGGVRLLF